MKRGDFVVVVLAALLSVMTCDRLFANGFER